MFCDISWCFLIFYHIRYFMFHDVSLCFMTFRDTSWYLIKIPDVSTLFHQIRDDAYRISVEFGDSWFFLVSHNPLTKAPRMAHWKAQREGRRSSPRASLGAHDQKAVKMKWCTTNEFFLKKKVFLFFLGALHRSKPECFFLNSALGIDWEAEKLECLRDIL